jgi:2'-5' RNA ligase
VNDEWRIFCAVELPELIRTRIEKHIEQLRATVPESQASWSRSSNIHLTLKFFGNVERSRVDSITEALTTAAKDVSPFGVSIGGAGAFPNAKQPRVLWIGVNDPTRHLKTLHDDVDEACAKKGFEKDTRAYRPHLTIARLRKPEGARALAEANQRFGFESTEMLVNELLLFRSELSSNGSRYTVVSRHVLSDML